MTSGSGGIRTLSISRSEREWSASCLPSHDPVRSNTRGGIQTHMHPVLSRAARPVGVPGRPSKSSGGWNRTSGLRVQSEASLPAATAPDHLGINLTRSHMSVRGGIRTSTARFKAGQPAVSRSPRAPRGSRTRLSGLEDRCLGRSARDASRKHSRAEGGGVEPPRLIARPFSRRLPSPVGLPFRDREAPGAGIEPARSSLGTGRE